MDLHGLTHICRHPPPPPWRYPGRAVPGRVDPRAGSLFSPFPYPGPWEVSPRGVGQTGRGQKPPPLSLYSICADVSLPGQRGTGEARGTPPEDLSNVRLTTSSSSLVLRGLSLLSICQHPPPRPASGLLPRPEGRGQSWRYPGKGRTRGASPYTGPWEVSPRGVGQTGRGQKPPPLSLLSICRHPPPRPASGLLPRPKGRGQSWRYPGKAVSGRVNPCASSLFRLAPYTGPWEASPRGEGQTGRRQKAPAPVSDFNMLASCSQYASIPPARPPASSPAPRAVSGRVDPRAGPLFSPHPYLCIQYAPTSLSPGQGGAREARRY